MAKIRNLDVLASTPLRKTALSIAEAGLEAIDTKKVMGAAVAVRGNALHIQRRKYRLKKNGVFVVAIGKCADEMASALAARLGDNLHGGFVLDIEKRQVDKMECWQGTHPLPSAENVAAAKKLVSILQGLDREDLVIFAISGGGSTLLCLPPEGAGWEDEARVLKDLFRRGADIEDINIVRKHMSLARGGYLAQYAYPARAVTLLFSDVPGDDVALIASGPTIKDRTTIADAEKILKRYGIEGWGKGSRLSLVETPKGLKYFRRVDNILLVSNKHALKAMGQKAVKLGYRSKIRSTNLVGETKEVAQKITQELQREKPKTVLLYGGETTVVLKVKGEGGRNQELTLAALLSLKENGLLISLASDGRDNGEYAGGIADRVTSQHAQTRELNVKWYLDNNQSTQFFRTTEDFILTGDTGANVSDLIIAING